MDRRSVDFQSPAEVFVVFPGRSFAMPGDEADRAAAQTHGQSAGVPEAQLDWPE